MQDLMIFAIKISILFLSYLLSNFFSKKLKVKVIRILYNKSHNFESRAFLFKLLLKLIAPILFLIISAIIAFTLPHVIYQINSPFIREIPFNITVSTISLSVKISLIWAIYRIASLSSINKMINQLFAIILLISSLVNFLGINSYINNFFGNFKANFGSFEVSIYKAFLFVIILGGILWFNKVILESLKKILDTSEINTNIKTLFVKFLSILLFLVVLLIGLSSLGVDLQSLAIFGSALAVGLGFGFQKLVSNIISGIAISFEEIIKEGDIILIDDKREVKGTVKSLNMRYILIEEFDGKAVMIPNDTIITSNIANLTHTNNYLRMRIDFTVGNEVSLESFRTDIMHIMNSNPYASKIEESVFHIDSLTEIGVKIFLLFWIDDPYEINVARTSLLFSIHNYLVTKGVNIPAPLSKIEFYRKK